MDVNALYNVAKGFVNKMRNEKPEVASESDAAICLIVTDNEEIYSGFTGIGIHNGNIVSYPAECVALIAMFAAGKFKAKQLIVVSMADYSVTVPCIECLEMLMLLDTDNDCCETAVSEDRFVLVKELMSDEEPEDEPDDDESEASSETVDFFSGFGDADEEGDAAAAFEGGFDESYAAPQHEPVKKNADENSSLGAPAEFASEVAVDESNPFYEAPKEAGTQEADAAETKKPGTKSHFETKGSDTPEPAKTLSKAELLKQAKKKKKVAKSNFAFFKKKS